LHIVRGQTPKTPRRYFSPWRYEPLEKRAACLISSAGDPVAVAVATVPHHLDEARPRQDEPLVDQAVEVLGGLVQALQLRVAQDGRLCAVTHMPSRRPQGVSHTADALCYPGRGAAAVPVS